MVQLSTPGVTPNREMGPPRGVFCQITLTSCYASVRQNWKMEAQCSRPVRPSVRPFIRLLPNVRIRYFENEQTYSDANCPKRPTLSLRLGGQKSRSHDAEDRFASLAESSHLAPFGRWLLLFNVFKIFYVFIIKKNFCQNCQRETSS